MPVYVYTIYRSHYVLKNTRSLSVGKSREILVSVDKVFFSMRKELLSSEKITIRAKTEIYKNYA